MHEAAVLVDRVVTATVGLLDLATIHLGERLGLYASLRDHGPATSAELAGRTGTDERYIREWLEQQAVTAVLTVGQDGRFALPAGHAEALLDRSSPNYIGPLGRQSLGMLIPLPQLMTAFVSGEGVPYADYGSQTREGIADLNRTMFGNDLGSSWFPALPDVHARLRAAPAARVADVGCGEGWSSLSIAHAYPDVHVDGFDIDPDSIRAAKANASAEGLSERVTFTLVDPQARPVGTGYQLATIFEAVHDMARPVEVLRAVHGMLAEDAILLVADERVAEEFHAPGDEVERMMYGFSVLHCLPVGRAGDPESAATGTVMRPATLESYARQAGFSAVEVAPIENDFWRFYRLSP